MQFIPGVGQAAGAVLGVAAGAFALGAMAGHAVQGMRGQKGGWAKMGLDALSVIPMGKGAIALTKGAKAVKGADETGTGAATVASPTRLRNARDAVNNGMKNPLSQKYVLGPAERGVAKAFGKDLTTSQLKNLDHFSQLGVKGGSFGAGAWTQATSKS